jgi:hypothetical protein
MHVFQSGQGSLRLKVLALLGFTELARPLRVLEETLLFADVRLFAVIFPSGAAVFAAETITAAKRRISHLLGETHRDR